jgi:hypothetical protein
MLRRVGAVLVWVALAIIAAASIGAGAYMIYAANSSEVSYKQFASDSAKADSQRANINKQRSCGPLPTQARAKCEAEEYYSAHQAEHDDRDLEAQRTTAIWTRYLGIAGIVGTAFGLLGVVLVLLTFAEQRKTSRAELRAYVFPEKARLLDGTNPKLREDNVGVPAAEVVIKNFGNTPARNVRHCGALILVPMNFAEEPRHHPGLEAYIGSTLAPGAWQTGIYALSGAPIEDLDGRFCLSHLGVHDIRAGTWALMLYGKILYEDGFGNSRMTEYRLYHTNHWPLDDGEGPMRFTTRGNRDE